MSVEPEPVTVKSVPVVEVAMVTAGPVVVCPVGPIEVRAEVKPWVRHVEPIAKHPVVSAIPFAKVEVPVPVTARVVVVAFVVVAFTPVKFWSVVEPVWSVFENVESPPVAVSAVPTESAPVVVALVDVELRAVKF